MLILILETGGEKGGLILAKGPQVLASKSLLGGPELSKRLASEVQALLGEQVPGLIAVSKGPGSYTGIRVGVALARALAYGWNIPCLGFSKENFDSYKVWDQFLKEGAPPFALEYLPS